MVNPLEMSDEDFLAQGDVITQPGEADTTEVQQEETPAESVVTEGEAQVNEEDLELTEAEKAAAADGEEVEGSDVKEPVAAEPVVEEPKPDEIKPEEKPATGEETPAPTDTPKVEAPAAVSEAEAVDYQGFYTKITTSFKANGRLIEVKTPEEAIQLMQQGANYTRKMQELAPHRKTLLMLEKNGLLDEGKLGFLIDLEKRDPAAIQKLLKDSGVDPMDIDVSKDSTYQAGAHSVDDKEVKFMAVLGDLKSTPEGMATLQVMDTSWDKASKDHLWASPEAMTTIHEHRESGIYDRITAEVDRLKTLGTIAADVPFLEAYRVVGEKMAATSAFDDLIKPIVSSPEPAPAATPKVVVATRVATPKPAVVNSDKAAAASPTRTTPATARPFVNPLAMSDEEFMKQSEGRV